MIVHRKVLVVAVALAMLAALVLAASCGQTETGGATPPEQASGSGDATVDDLIRQMDDQLNSVDPDDFSEGELSDRELGL